LGITKESLVLGAMGFMAGIYLDWDLGRKKNFILSFIFLSLFFWLTMFLKYYYALIFLPLLLSTLIIHKLRNRWFWLNKNAYGFSCWSLVVILLIVLASLTHPNLNLNTLLEVVIKNNNTYQEISKPDNLIHFNDLNTNWGSIMRNFHLAIFSGLFRPLVFEGGNILKLIAGIENTLLLIFFFGALGNLPAILNSKYKFLFTAMVVYIIILAVFLSLSTPNLGTLVRYRVGFSPFLVYLILSNNYLAKKLKLAF